MRVFRLDETNLGFIFGQVEHFLLHKEAKALTQLGLLALVVVEVLELQHIEEAFSLRM